MQTLWLFIVNYSEKSDIDHTKWAKIRKDCQISHIFVEGNTSELLSACWKGFSSVRLVSCDKNAKEPRTQHAMPGWLT